MQCDTVFKLFKDSLWRHRRGVRSRKWFRHMCNFCSISTILSHRLSNCTLTVDLTRSLSHSYSELISISLCNLILSWLISPWLSIVVPSLQSSSYDSRVSFLTNSPDRRHFLCEWNEIAWLYKVPLISDCRLEPIIIKRKKRSSVCTWHS